MAYDGQLINSRPNTSGRTRARFAVAIFVGVTQIAGGILLCVYLVRAIVVSGVPPLPQVTLGFCLAFSAIVAGSLLLKSTRIGYTLSRGVQLIQLVSVSLPKLGFVVVLGPQLRLAFNADSSLAVNAGFFSFYALFAGQNGEVPWGINLVPLIVLLTLRDPAIPLPPRSKDAPASHSHAALQSPHDETGLPGD
jgi:hypothetical protein